MLEHLTAVPGFLSVVGFIVGMLVGMTGMGAGVLVTPLLLIGVGLPATVAIGTDLAYGAVTKLAGTVQHWRQKTVDKTFVLWLGVGSIPASLVAVATLSWLHRFDAGATELWLNRLVGAALLLASLMIFRKVFSRTSHDFASTAGEVRHRRLVLIGILGGFLVGLTSVGSGSILIALMVAFAPLSVEKMVGTDIAHAFFLVSAAAVAHMFAGNVDFGIAGRLILGSIPGILIGSRMTLWLPKRVLQFGLAGLLLTSAGHLLIYSG